MSNTLILNNADTTIRPQGSLDRRGAVALRSELESILAEEGDDVVMDLSAGNYIYGAGIGAIAFLFKRLVASGRSLRVTGASGQPRSMLNDLGLAHLLGLPVARNPRWFRFGPQRAALAKAA